MTKAQWIQLAENEYYRELLRQDQDPNERKLELLRNFLDEAKPVPVMERFEPDVFYKTLEEKIKARERFQVPRVLGKVAGIAMVLMLCGNGVCEAATNHSIFYYMNEIREKVTEFTIGFDDSSNSKTKDTSITEDEVVAYEEKEVSTWNDVKALCPWQFVYPRSVPFANSTITVTCDEGKGNAIFAQYEHGDEFITVHVLHYEDEKGVIDYSFGSENEAKVRKRLKVANIRFVVYQTAEEYICIGTSKKNVYEIHSTQNYDAVIKLLHSIK